MPLSALDRCCPRRARGGGDGEGEGRRFRLDLLPRFTCLLLEREAALELLPDRAALALCLRLLCAAERENEKMEHIAHSVCLFVCY